MSEYIDRELEFKKRIMDIEKRVRQNSNFCLLKFLDPRKQQIIKETIKSPDIFVGFDGGFKDAEYKRCLIAPFCSESFRIKAFKIEYNHRFLELNHRIILGSLTSLGIERETFGDIILCKNDFYIFVMEEISDYIKMNLKTISGKPISLEEILPSDIVVCINYEEKNIFSSSLRLDSIIAQAYQISREKSQEMISLNLVKVNYKETTNNTYLVKENDLISVRKKGRFKILEFIGKTKSGKENIKIGYVK